MAETIRVSEEFYAAVVAHGREGETITETLRRLVGCPDPEAIRDIVGEEPSDSATNVREAIERRRDAGN